MRKRLQQFLQLESTSGIILFISALISLIWANSPFHYLHDHFIETFLFWINEGLMAVFFLLVGLELKNAYLEGELSKLSEIMLPFVAAIGGMVVPAAIYVLFNYHDPIALKGWSTPVATDIAFALGVLLLFGKRVPVPLKLFLLSLAIFDDIGAILIIALFYSHGVSFLALSQAVLVTIILFLLNKLRVNALLPFLVLGMILWLTLLHSGIHPTVAGVILALAIPSNKTKINSPSHRLEDRLHPWVAFLILPLFALANAAFSLQDLSWQALTDSIVLGIALGLFIGKQIGVFGFSWIFVKLGFAQLSAKINWPMLYGTAIICGIGFTMSLFLGTLSFEPQSRYLADVRLGVIIGSILSGFTGAMVLLVALSEKNKTNRSSNID